MKWVLSVSIAGCLLCLALSCDSNPYRQGKALYQANCASCHMDDGSGLRALIPPLNQPDDLQSKSDELPCIIRYGKKGPIQVGDKRYDQVMAGHPELSVTQISNIINYVRNAWGNELGYYPPDSVRSALEGCSGREVIE